MKTEVRLISPEVANEMLKRNANNRKLNNYHCIYLANQMTSDQWKFDGQPIRFSEGGTLLDGQHRLSAVIRSGKSQQFLIVTGIEKDAFKVMDTGKNRNGADCFSIRGIEYASDVAASVRMVINYRLKKDNANGRNKPTNTDLLEWYDKNPSILNHVKSAAPLSVEFSYVLSRSYLAGLLFLFSGRNVLEAESFISKLCTGLDLEKDSPIYALRKKLLEDKMNRTKLPVRDKLALIIKAWNSYRLGKKIKQLRWDKAREIFPAIR